MHEEEEGTERKRRARGHSTRAAILSVLDQERELSVSQIRTEMHSDLALRNLYYHLRVLKACRLLDEDNGCYKLA